jgi:V8-like Glu-specific endopeptidase
MPLTSSDFLADVAAVYNGGSTNGAFGSGRLIAPNLILTTGHVIDYPTRDAPARTRWKVRLLREKLQDGAWGNPHDAKLVWRVS